MKLIRLLLTLGSPACLLVSTSLAGPEPAPMEKNVLPAPPPSSRWTFDLTLYGWLTAVDGDMGVHDVTADASMSIGDVLDDLDFAYMSAFEARYERWGFSIDGFYANLSDDESFSHGAFTGSASLEYEQAFITKRVMYRVLATDNASIDLFAGARWSYYDIDLNVDTSLGSRRFNATEGFIDPIVGARVRIDLNPKWYLQASGDIGGFGANSELIWQGFAAVGYRCNDRWSVFAGFRGMGVDYEKDGFKVDTTMYGPVVGATVSF